VLRSKVSVRLPGIPADDPRRPQTASGTLAADGLLENKLPWRQVVYRSLRDMGYCPRLSRLFDSPILHNIVRTSISERWSTRNSIWLSRPPLLMSDAYAPAQSWTSSSRSSGTTPFEVASSSRDAMFFDAVESGCALAGTRPNSSRRFPISWQRSAQSHAFSGFQYSVPFSSRSI
jgi:hypothetical protein